MKAVFLDFATMGTGLDSDALLQQLPALEMFESTSPEQLNERLRDAEFVFVNKTRLPAAVFEQHPSLKYIGLAATGTDNVDLDAARAHEVAVCNIRGYCTNSVAEHVFGCLLQLTRHLGEYNAAVRRGEWQTATEFCLLSYPMRELASMTLAIVGYGTLGQGVAQVAMAFGMQVIVSARPGSDSVEKDRVSFDELLQRADVISLHCPLNETTAGLFGSAEFKAMKSDAILINTARGGLVDSIALVAALRNGEIAAAAVDVLTSEPPVDGDPLLDYDGKNLLLTPHIAWASNEARQLAIDDMAANVAAFLAGERRNRVV